MKVSAKQYANTLYSLTESKGEREIDQVIVKFVSYLKKTGNLKKSHDIVEQFNAVYNEQHNIIEATVTSARTLDINEQNKIKLFIGNHYGASDVIAQYVIDRKIKGGIIIKVGDEVLDGSIQQRINILNRNLKVKT